MTVAKPKNFKKSLGKLFGILKPYRISIFITIILTIISTIFSIVSPKLLGNMTNQIVNDLISVKIYNTIHENLEDITLPTGTTISNLQDTLKNLENETNDVGTRFIVSNDENLENINQILANKSYLNGLTESQQIEIQNLDISQKPIFHYEILGKIALFLIVLYVFSAVASYVSVWIFANVIQKIVYNFRQRLSQKINKMPISYFDKNQFGDVLSRITNDVDTLAQSMNQIASQAVSSVIMVIGFLVMMFIISWQLTIIALIVLPISLLFVKFIT
jgi:ATP-binding cassette subfamily B protein